MSVQQAASIDEFDPENRDRVVAAAQAMRQVICSHVVDRDDGGTQSLIDEHVDTHGVYLVYVAAKFVQEHATAGGAAELAESGFFYLLTRIGDLNALVATQQGSDADTKLLAVLGLLREIETQSGLEPGRALAFRAAQTCLVAHHFVRQGRAPWGIQQNLDRNDMLALNEALALVLIIIAVEWPQGAADCRVAVTSLLGDARRILTAGARAAGISVSDLVARYFTELSLRECQVDETGITSVEKNLDQDQNLT